MARRVWFPKPSYRRVVRARRGIAGSRVPSLGVGSWLLMVLLAGGVIGPSTYPDEFPLFPTLGNEGASGMAYLTQTWSPFGISVDRDGNVEYEITIEVKDLPGMAGQSYRVWLTTPTLEEIRDLGTVPGTGTVEATTNWKQILVVVSRESSDRAVASGERWSGPIVLRGFSAGARVQPLGSHSIFQPAPM